MNAPLKPLGETGFYGTDTPRILRTPRPAPLRVLVGLFLITVIGALLGIGSAYVIIEAERPFNAVEIGPWEAYPLAGTKDADPYSVAIYTRGAIIPLANGEGLALTARTDSADSILDPSCTYRISGQTPTARLWTLTATDRHGRLFETLPGRTFLTSRGLLRKPDSSFDIIASRSAQPGNWLPLPADPQSVEGLYLTLRLYDAPVTTGAAIEGVSMPSIRILGC
ncbi:hypothetical protein JM93_00818 [Roseibium hamelinense]|uniref:DUF1214 domain-containing protein n=1 Tax=Roseibium hamelinense TaxID=150831 RepID=A0A562TIM8_9HYPH|nr:DUF1214 domain-containing protein [Roseibium hamelinense]MTI42639.1 DUF1214 domain-containing protein [Roseibium hamelinense]TWI93263.1 hypothetical protein JM93_00818 [Roseibium hamelinense]